MASRTWVTYPDQLIYRRPYEDAWGILHDPTTEWDELLKNYKPWVMLLQVGDGTRRMAQPASVGAQRIIRREQHRRQQNATGMSSLEADYLERTNCRKHWKRRQKRKLKVQATRVSYEKVTIGA